MEPIEAWDEFLEAADLENRALSLEPYCPGCCPPSTRCPAATLISLGRVSATLRKGLLNPGRCLLASVVHSMVQVLKGNVEFVFGR